MQKQLINNEKALFNFIEDIAPGYNIDADFLLSEFGYEYVNSDGQSYEEYTDSLADGDYINFEAESYRKRDESLCPETFPVLVVYKADFDLDRYDIIYEYVYKHDF
jgi:hypothetical protein